MIKNMKISLLVLLLVSLVLSGAIIINEKELLIDRSNKTMENFITKHHLNLFKFNFASSEGITVNKGQEYEDSHKLDEVIRIYERLEGNLDKDNFKTGYAINASIAYWFTQQPYRAIEILEKVDKELPTYIENKLVLSGMYLAIGESTKAHDLIVKCYINKNNPYKKLTNDLMAYSYVLSNNKVNLNKTLKNKFENKQEPSRFLKVLDLDFFIDSIDNNAIKLQVSKNTLTGRMINGSKPVKGAYIYLTPVNKEINHNDSIDFTNYNFGVSNEKGRYTIKNIPDGRYNVCIMVNNSSLDNKNIRFDYKEVVFNDEINNFSNNVRFYDKIEIKKIKLKANDQLEIEWENPIKDIVDYTIEFGKVVDKEKNIIQYYPSNQIQCKNTSILINFDTFPRSCMSYISNRDKDGNIDPNELIEPFYTSGEYVVNIHGQAVNDTEFLLCDSNPESFEYDEGKQYCEGDELLLKGNYKKALEWFEDRILRHSSDIHALKVLSTLRTQGYKGFDNNALGVDVDKALYYTSSLKNYIGSNKLLTERLAILNEIKEEYDESMMYYNHLIKGYNYFEAYEDLARVQMKANKWPNALISFENYYKKVNSDKYGYIVFLSLLTNDEQDIRKYTMNLSSKSDIINKNTFNNYLKLDKKKYNKFFRYIKYNDMFNAREELRYDTTELGIFYKALLELAYDNVFASRKDEQYIKDFNLYMNNEKNRELKEILEYINQNVVL